MSADGPFNLYNAVVTAAYKQPGQPRRAGGTNDTVTDGRDKILRPIRLTWRRLKRLTTARWVISTTVKLTTSVRQSVNIPPPPRSTSKLTALPKVGIVYNYANASDLSAKALVDVGYDGIVSAGVGNGNLYKTVF